MSRVNEKLYCAESRLGLVSRESKAISGNVYTLLRTILRAAATGLSKADIPSLLGWSWDIHFNKSPKCGSKEFYV